MSINKFQKLMHQIYFSRDFERGKDKTIDWLKDEVEELEAALNKGDINAAEKEFADVLAWLASLANIANINLEKAAFSKYNNKCPKCNHNPCDCPVS